MEEQTVEALIGRCFRPELLLPLAAARALYAGLPEKSPGLAGSTTRKGAYPDEVAAVMANVRDHFRPSGFSMSPDSLTTLIELVKAAGWTRVLEFGAGVSTFALPALVPQPLRYLSIEEDAGYAASIRAGLAVGGEKYGDVDIAQLDPGTSKIKVSLVGGKTIRAVRFEKLAETVRDAFGAHPPQIVIIDGPSSRMRWGRYAALIDLLDLLPKGTVVLLDDALRHREVNILNAWSNHPRIDVRGIYCLGTGTGISILK